MEKSPGVILVTKFVQGDSKVFKSYVDYIDREEAVRNRAFKDFTCFDEYVGDYMDNHEKTYGLFTDRRNFLGDNEKSELKDLFSTAQKNGSLMWQTVISFDNTFLMENGLYDLATADIDEAKLREYTRKTMSTLLAKENLTDAVWAASVHKNTDNIHVHIATVQPEPSWVIGRSRCREAENGKLYQRGKFKQGSIDAAKSTFANCIARDRVDNQKINSILRDRLLMNVRSFSLINQDEELRQEFLNLSELLPDDLRLLKYGNNAMKEYREAIDHLSMGLIEKYFSEEYKELKKTLQEADEAYISIYGEGKRKFSDGHLEDLKKRMGNAVLQQAVDYKKEQRMANRVQMHLNRDAKQDTGSTKNSFMAHRHISQMRKSVQLALGKSRDNLKNQAAYRRLLEEMDRT